MVTDTLPPSASPLEQDTIFALASGPGPCAVAVFRLSGPGCQSCLQDLLRGPLPPARRLSLKQLHLADGTVLDQSLVVFFPAPESYTGEDMAELHVHGGQATLISASERLAGYNGMRPAEPGEFTRRAFANGRMDLTAVEGLADLIHARTESQRRQALRQASGGLYALCQSYRERLIDISARIESLIDFADEDLPTGLDEQVGADIMALRQEIADHIQQSARAEALQTGLRLAIVGPPNAGKSTLMNWLSGSDRAIVSATPGTTRDTVTTQIILADVPVEMVDTAGLRTTTDAIEQEGIRRTQATIDSADLILSLHACDQLPDGSFEITPPPGVPLLHIQTKIDLQATDTPPDSCDYAISVKSGQGLADLYQNLENIAQSQAGLSESITFTCARQRHAIGEIAEALAEAESAQSLDIRAEFIRHALFALGRITGTIDVESVLDRVFQQFCIGK